MKKDLGPLLKADNKINFSKNFPDTEYAIDLRFKKDLIQNQLSAKNFILQNITFQFKNGYQQLTG